MAELAGLPAPTVPQPIDGVSLVPLFNGNPLARSKPLYWFYNPSRPVCVIRKNSWVLIADPVLDGEVSTWAGAAVRAIVGLLALLAAIDWATPQTGSRLGTMRSASLGSITALSTCP